MANHTHWTAAGSDNLQWSHVSSSGYITGTAKLTAASTGTASNMGRFRGQNSVAFSLPEPTVVNTQGDDTILASFMFGAASPFQFDFTTQALDLNFLAAATGVTSVTEVGRVMAAGSSFYPAANQLALMWTRQAKSMTAGQAGAKMYEVLELPRCEVSLISAPRNFQAAGEYTWRVVVSPTDTLPDGRLVEDVFTTSPDGMLSYLMHSADNRLSRTAFVGDNTIDDIPLAYKAVDVGTTQATVETTGFAAGTVSSVTSTSPYTAALSAAPASGKFSIVTYQFVNF